MSEILNATECPQALIHIMIAGGGWHESHLYDVKNLQKVNDSPNILKMLSDNRVDVYIEQQALMHYQITHLGLQNKIAEIDNVMDTTQWHLHIGKSSQYAKIMPSLDRLLEKMSNDGTLEQLKLKIFAKYVKGAQR